MVHVNKILTKMIIIKMILKYYQQTGMLEMHLAVECPSNYPSIILSINHRVLFKFSGVTVIRSETDTFPTLPVLSTLEKLGMGAKNGGFGSRSSLKSTGSSGSNSNRRS